MTFDFETFANITGRVYPSTAEYSLHDVLTVFEYYFHAYEEYMGKPHPNIRIGQIRKIIEEMPIAYMPDHPEELFNLDPEDYPPIIDKHFSTEYKGCDFNINHFFSGKVRMMRFFELSV